MKKCIVLVVIVLLPVLIFAGYAETSPVRQDASEPDLYVFATLLSELDCFIDYQYALDMAESELGVQTEFIGPKEYDLKALIDEITQMIDKKRVTGLIVFGWEDALIPVINHAAEKDIFVCTVRQDLEGSGRTLFIGLDNYEIGRQAAEWMCNEIGGSGRIVIIADMQMNNISERKRGINSVLGDYNNIEIIAEVDTKSDKEIALQKTRQLLLKYDNITGIIAADSISSYAVAKLMDGTSYAEQGIHVICFDRENEVLHGIQSGYISKSIVCNTALEVYLAIQEGQRRKYSTLQLSYNDAAANVNMGMSYVNPGYCVVDKNNVNCFIRK